MDKKAALIAFVIAIVACMIAVLLMQIINGATGLSDQIVAMFQKT